MSLVEELLALNDRKVQPVPVAEWSRIVWVRAMTMREALALADEVTALKDDAEGMTALQLKAFMCDESGGLLFQSVEQAKALLDKSPTALKTIIDAGTALNGLGSKDTQKEKF